MGHYYGEMCCQKCMNIPCKCSPSPALKKAIADQREKDWDRLVMVSKAMKASLDRYFKPLKIKAKKNGKKKSKKARS